ncbi:two-component regulator propeller domain-containing protein [Paraflavisolibacter sp. H34]|uniref:two-component regulator propeller domain-containing protein n=1 Tax=Huijunlia imazamoxiresistens TaxID=3127457 RepID=UPI003015B637
MFRFLLLLAAFFLAVASLKAQPKCIIEHYTAEDGLSHEAVTSMLKDREGFMWFGTWNGINRFDGHSFVAYKSSPGDRSQLRNDRIDQIVEDQSNHLWLRAYDRAIYRFDKQTEQFIPLSTVINPGKTPVAFRRVVSAGDGLVWLESVDDGLYAVPQDDLKPGRFAHYKKGLPGGYGLPSNTINLFYKESETRIWIGTSAGLCCLVRSASGVYASSQPQPQLTAGIEITVVAGDAAYLYFGTADGQLLTLEKRSGKFSRRPIATGRLNALFRSRISNRLYATTMAGEVVTVDGATQAVTTAAYRSGGLLRSIYEDRSGTLWLEPETQGVVRYDPATASFRQFVSEWTNPDNFAGNRYWVFEDNNGLVWVKMKGGGLMYYNTGTASMASLFHGPPATGGASFSNVIHGLYYDTTGVLWLTTDERGLVKVIFPGDAFHQQLVEARGALKADNEIRGLAYDRKGRLWLGAKSGKLYVYQDGRPLSGLFVNEPKGGPGQVYSILQDRQGNLWLGTKAHGLYKATPLNAEATKYRLAHFEVDKKNPRSLQGNEIYALLEDRQGRIWVGTFDEGLHLVAGTGDSLTFVHSGPAFANYPQNAFRKIRHMALDGSGNIWIGTTDGLLVVDGNSSPAGLRLAPYSKVPGDRQSLGNSDIQFIYRDAKNRMWLATSGGGLARALGSAPLKELVFRNYTTRDGLPNDYVLSCTEDDRGHLWIATENGLSRFQPEQTIFRNYDAYDGLPRVGFSEAACSRSPDGRIVFGTSRGYLAFHPGRIGTHRPPAKIALTALQINNEEAGPAGEEAVLTGNINYLPELTLRYDQDILTIDYALLDQRSGDRQAMAYRLIGFDTTWYHNKQQRRTTYTNLPPGHYVFEVKSLSSDLYGQAPYRRLTITIEPPPWRTWWAYLLYLVVAGLLIAAIRRTTLTLLGLRQKIAVEQKLAALKMSFFTNVSHELRTPLTLILNPLEQLARKEKFSPEGTALVEVVRKNAHRMVRFINQLLDLRKVQSDKARLLVAYTDVLTLVRMTSDYFAEAARTKRIRLQISAEQKSLMAWVDAEKLETVLYNLLGNAFKFTPDGKTITINIRPVPGENYFTIEVSDQGPGVAPDKLQAIFELYYEGEQRAGTDLKGTGIGLALARELVALHGGTIKAANNEQGGLAVSVQLPLGRDHFDPAQVTFVEAPVPAAPVPGKTIGEQLLPQPRYAEAPKGAETPMVLLVEDNDELRSFLKGQLGEVYRVEAAANGAEGWQKARELMPDLIVSDIMMPVMDGIQLLDKVRNDRETSHIPVVLLSAKYAVESQVEGLKYGADYYITKPFENEFLLACIDNLLRQRKSLFEALVEKKKTVPLSPEPIVVTSKDEAFLKDVIRVVEEKMADAEFNIETVAETVGMSRTTFYKKFKSLTNLTPVEFVREMRLQRAKQYLDAGGSNISEAAYLAGFSNPKYFSTCFREKYHLSPSEYLKTK